MAQPSNDSKPTNVTNLQLAKQQITVLLDEIDKCPPISLTVAPTAELWNQQYKTAQQIKSKTLYLLDKLKEQLCSIKDNISELDEDMLKAIDERIELLKRRLILCDKRLECIWNEMVVNIEYMSEEEEEEPSVDRPIVLDIEQVFKQFPAQIRDRIMGNKP